VGFDGILGSYAWPALATQLVKAQFLHHSKQIGNMAESL
jgi:hypothetical protein